MKKWILIFIPIIIYSCKQKNDNIVGDWIVQSRFYQATYQIIEDDNQWNALVLHYNDGTTRYKYDGIQKRFAFKGLTKSKTAYVDGLSGATKSSGAKAKTIEINKKSKDTLEVTTYSMNKPIVELWVRKNIKNGKENHSN